MTDPAADQARRRHQALAVTTAFLALFAIVGFALYGLPRLYPAIRAELGWSRWRVTSGNAFSKVGVAIVFGFLAGRIVDSFGPRRLMLAGIFMAGGALVGLSFVSGFALFYFFYCFNALGYVCGGPLPNQVLLSGWFDKARGKAMGVAYLGIGVGGALVPFVVTTFRETFGWGWRGALQAVGLLMIVIALPAAFLVREPPKPAAPRTPGEAPSLKGVLRRPAFYLLALGSMASIGAVGGTVQNLAQYLTERRLSERDIDVVQSLVLVGSLAGRLLMGWLADRWAKKHVMILIYVIVAASIPLMVFAPTPGLIKLFAVVFGVGLGGDYMIIPLMAAELFGLQVMGRVMGVVLTADSVAESLAPMGVAALGDGGTWSTGFLILLGLAAVGALAVSLLPKPGADPPAAQKA